MLTKYVDFKNQTTEKEYITLSGCTNNRSFVKVTFGKWKQNMQSVFLHVYKISNLFNNTF